MLVPNNPDINVGKLLEKVRQELICAHSRPKIPVMAVSRHEHSNQMLSFDKSRLQALSEFVTTIHQRSAVRSSLPDWVRKRFPLFRVGLLERIVLRLTNALLHDQRIANQAIADSLRLLGGEIANLSTAMEARVDAARREATIALEIQTAALTRELETLKADRSLPSALPSGRDGLPDHAVDGLHNDDLGSLRGTPKSN